MGVANCKIIVHKVTAFKPTFFSLHNYIHEIQSDKALLKIWGKKKVMLPVREADLSIVKYHKSAIKMTKTRIEIIRKKRNAMHKYLRNDIADLLKNGLDINA
ncbi:Uncharacterized protein Fot_56258 [Forsythia ovata]|uniref:Uncharacterized protein n=1 Tax=Forsythia ovata TaxID=205694 RepID=A0ABD1P0P2_9LAMI